MSNSDNTTQKLPIWELLGASVLFFVGIFFIGQFYLGIFKDASPLFLIWLQWMGIVMCAQSSISFAEIIAASKSLILFFLRKAVDVVSIILLIWLRGHTEIIPLISFSSGEWRLIEGSSFFETACRWILTIIIFFSIIDLISSSFKAIKSLPAFRKESDESESELINS